MHSIDHHRIADLLDRLGPAATEQDARRIDPALRQAYPGVAIPDLPAEMFSWLRDGTGQAPVVCVVPASATSLLGLYADMDEDKRARLLASAQALATT